MKDKKLQTKRSAKKGFRALYAKTMERRQKASTSAAADLDDIEGDIPKVGIGRALTVILILHIVAIAAIYIGTKWKGSEPAGSNSVAAYNEDDKDSSPKVKDNSKNQHKFRVGQPSSYQDFERSPSVGHQMPTEGSNPVATAPFEARQPRVILPKRNPNAHVNLPPVQTIRYKSYTIKSGDSIYRIALRNEVKMQDLLNLNNIADAKKVRVGRVIKIPAR